MQTVLEAAWRANPLERGDLSSLSTTLESAIDGRVASSTDALMASVDSRSTTASNLIDHSEFEMALTRSHSPILTEAFETSSTSRHPTWYHGIL